MRLLKLFVVLLLLLSVFNGCKRDNYTILHSDGESYIDIAYYIVDENNGAPVANAKITYFRRGRESAEIFLRRDGKVETYLEPKGKETVKHYYYSKSKANEDGYGVIECIFHTNTEKDNTGKWDHENKIFYVFDDCEFLVEADRYETKLIKCGDLIGKESKRVKEFKATVWIKLKKSV